jgi:hypothetical protein
VADRQAFQIQMGVSRRSRWLLVGLWSGLLLGLSRWCGFLQGLPGSTPCC